MQAYILETGRRISPFGQPVGEMLVHNRPLREHQLGILRELGCQVETIDDLHQARQKPCLLVYDDVYFTYHAAAKFIALAQRGRRPANSPGGGNTTSGNVFAALSASPLTERFVPSFQGRTVAGADDTRLRAYDFYHLSQWDAGQSPADQAAPLIVPQYITHRRWRVNRYFDPSGSYTLPMSAVAFCPVQHWSSLLSANVLGMPSHFLRSAAAAKMRVATLPLRLLWRAASLWPYRLRGKLYLAADGCKVHPTAHVEWAVLGRGVRIGPNAVVRGAVLGDRVEIGPGALVEMSTLAEKATVNGGASVRSCVVGQEGHLGSYFTQLSLLGNGAVLCPASGIFDFNLRGNVGVQFEGRNVNSGSRLLGGCLGHGAFLGADVFMSSGQELPNGCVLVKNPRDVVGDVGQTLPPGVVRVDRGRPRHRSSGTAFRVQGG